MSVAHPGRRAWRAGGPVTAAKEMREATPSPQWAQRTVLDAVNGFAQTGLDSNPTKGGDVSIPLRQVKGRAGGQAHASIQCHPNPDHPPRQQLTGHLPAGSITILTSQSSAGSPAGGLGVQRVPLQRWVCPGALGAGSTGSGASTPASPARLSPPHGNFMATAHKL